MDTQQAVGWISSIVMILLGLWAVYPSWFPSIAVLPWILGGLSILLGLFWIVWMAKGMSKK